MRVLSKNIVRTLNKRLSMTVLDTPKASYVYTGHSRQLHHNPDTIPNAPPHGDLRIPLENELPSKAQVVIAGSGMIGNSVAFHLTQVGFKDIVVIDKAQVAGGTSRTGSGMLGMFRPSHERKIVRYCIDLYRTLQQKGFQIGLVECGSLNLAATKDRMVSIQRRAARYKPTGLECHVLTKQELQEFHPFLYTEDLQGGVWVPEDAVVHPKFLSEVLAYLAYQGGTRFVGNTNVVQVLSDSSDMLGPTSNINYRVSGVETEYGVIDCEYFVNCGGIWAREIGKRSDPPVKVPICPAEHFFLTFKSIPEMGGKHLPNVRDYDNHTYLRTLGNTFMMGAFERKARYWELKDLANPHTHMPGVEDADLTGISEEHWRHMSPYISSITNRFPILKQTAYEMFINTPDAFTPDGRWLIGQAPEIGNYFVCAGMNGNPLQGAGGVGFLIAELMANKISSSSLLDFELARFTSLHNNPKFLKERTAEVVARHYEIRYPFMNEFKYGRKIRTSPIHRELESRGAVFGERMGWERPLYFDPYHKRDDPPSEAPRGTFGKPEYFDYIEEEYNACREGVGVIDMSSFAKFIIAGDKKSVVEYLQMLCSNDVDIPVGAIIPTGMLNEFGRYENDCMLVRKSNSSYFMVSPTPQQTRTFEWMENRLPSDSSVALQDVTSMFTVLTVAGPKSKDLMQEITNSDMDMHPFTYKYVNMGYASGVMVFAVTQTGEPGFSLYIPTEYALHLYDKIMAIGEGNVILLPAYITKARLIIAKVLFIYN